MKKTFFIFKVEDSGSVTESRSATEAAAGGLSFVEQFAGTVTDARALISSPAYDDGGYRVLEDTSGVIVRSTVNEPKTKVTFEPSRKKPRKEKAAK